MTTNAWRQESETPSLSEVFRTIAVGKTAGDRERIAWQWLVDAMAEHPRHRLRLEQRA